MKNFIAVVGLAMLGALCPGVGHAVDPVPPSYSGGVSFPNTDFVGVKVTAVNESAVGQSLVNAAGLLYGICNSGGSYGGYSLAFDTIALSVNANNMTKDSRTLLITPAVKTIANTDLNNLSEYGCWWPKHPVQFNNGLVGLLSASTHNARFYYRLVDGTQ